MPYVNYKGKTVWIDEGNLDEKVNPYWGNKSYEYAGRLSSQSAATAPASALPTLPTTPSAAIPTELDRAVRSKGMRTGYFQGLTGISPKELGIASPIVPISPVVPAAKIRGSGEEEESFVEKMEREEREREKAYQAQRQAQLERESRERIAWIQARGKDGIATGAISGGGVGAGIGLPSVLPPTVPPKTSTPSDVYWGKRDVGFQPSNALSANAFSMADNVSNLIKAPQIAESGVKQSLSNYMPALYGGGNGWETLPDGTIQKKKKPILSKSDTNTTGGDSTTGGGE